MPNARNLKLVFCSVGVVTLAVGSCVPAPPLMVDSFTSQFALPRHKQPGPLTDISAFTNTKLAALSEAQALSANAARPALANALESAPPFGGFARSISSPSYSSALGCLTQAVYYEAAGEPISGQRAVAQVVLNRVRHPAFPSSICDVVYQGSEKSTGCQFTFTCDGSLLRKPSRTGWENARRIAAAALSGAVEPGVGMATHYHANWVLPYWSLQLDKLSTVGAHIFYRWSGPWGRRRTFSQPYSGEHDESFAVLVSDPEAIASSDESASGPIAIAGNPQRTGSANGPLQTAGLLSLDDKAVRPLADEGRRLLVADERSSQLRGDSLHISGF